MTDPAFIICAALVLIFGIVIGNRIGQELGEHVVTTRSYWLCNAGALVAGILLVAVLGVLGLALIQPGVLGLMAGAIVGLKMSFGESVGPWRVLDRALNVNRAHRETAERGTGPERRRRRASGEAAPQLISVSGDKPANAPTKAKKTR